MGSYDQVPEGYDGPPPEHAICCNSKWSHKGLRHTHRTVDEVRGCCKAAADERAGTEVWPCSWLLEGHYDDGTSYTYECMLPTRYTGTDGSYECDGGHSHVPAQVRFEQGWDYAEDGHEAQRLARAGVRPVGMDGKSWL
jgi:hypothetical protein